jgi:tetratricopeptide (TPR) repeat protein
MVHCSRLEVGGRYRPVRFLNPDKRTSSVAAAGLCAGLLVCSPTLYDSGISSTHEPTVDHVAAAVSGGPSSNAALTRTTNIKTDSKAQSADPAQSDERDAFGRLLGINEFDAAIAHYDWIYTNHDLEFSKTYRDELLDYASSLNQAGKYDLAAALLEAYLAVYYTDVEALILQARVYRNEGRHLNAIESFQRARISEHRRSVSELILTQANTVIGEYVQGLREGNDVQAITEFYQWLTRSQPTVSGYHIGLTNAYAAQSRYDEAIAALRYVQHDVTVGGKARSLIYEFRAKSTGGESS